MLFLPVFPTGRFRPELGIASHFAVIVRYRSRFRILGQTDSPDLPQETRPMSEYLRWNPGITLGIDEIDLEHQTFVVLSLIHI